MTLEQLLSKKGYSAQEITDLSPLLANARFRKDLEEELTTSERATADLNEYDRWFTQEITPEHTKLLKERDEAIATAAAEKTRFETYQRQTMMRQAGKTQAEVDASEAAERSRLASEAAAKNGGFDPNKYVSADTFNQAYEKTGEAIASAINITTQHMQLFPGQYLDMEQLRNDARGARKPVKQFWEEKYGVAGKRAELAAKAKSDERALIAKEEREKLIVEFGGSNPNLQTPQPSNNPFVIRKSTRTDTKQPWEKNDNDMSRARIDKAIQNAAKRGELATA